MPYVVEESFHWPTPYAIVLHSFNLKWPPPTASGRTAPNSKKNSASAISFSRKSCTSSDRTGWGPRPNWARPKSSSGCWRCFFFYGPLAAVVIHLNRSMPLEGGLYQWAKLGFNDFIGFLVGWNLWLYIIVFMSSQGMNISTNIAYAIGLDWLGANKWFILVITITLIAFLIVVTVLGVSVGKWFQNAGGIAQIVTFGALILIPFLSLSSGKLHEYHPLAIAMPAVSLLSLNIFGKMSMGAFSGFEYVAILAGECKSPARTIGRSVLIASPIIALMFILGTSSILAYVSPEQVDLVGPIPQVLSIAFRSFHWAGLIGPLVILLLGCPAARRMHACGGRQHAASDGRRLGPFTARLVFEAPSEIQDPREFHTVRGGNDPDHRPGKSRRRRTTGSLSNSG